MPTPTHVLMLIQSVSYLLSLMPALFSTGGLTAMTEECESHRTEPLYQLEITAEGSYLFLTVAVLPGPEDLTLKIKCLSFFLGALLLECMSFFFIAQVE